jgi:TRAP-type C4-dicarboxylate transport system substrate-binding protein
MRRLRSALFMLLPLLCILTFLVVGCSSGTSSTTQATSSTPAAAAPQTFTLKVVSGLPEGHAGNRDMVSWTQALEERSGGRVTTELYEGTLGTPADFYDMIKNGVIDVMSMGDAWAPGQFPGMDINYFPFTYPNWTVVASVDLEMYYMGLMPGFEPFKLLYFKPTLIFVPFFKDKKVTKMEDLQGMIIRPPGGPVPAATVAALGATSKSLPGSETYMALAQGQIDCALTGVDNVIGRKFYEQTKYAIKNATVQAGSFVMIMNKDTWNKLPDDIKLIIEQLDLETYYQFLRDQQAEEQGYWDETIKQGVEVYNLDPAELARWKDATRGVAEQWAKDTDAKGLPGTQMLQTALQIAARYQQ